METTKRAFRDSLPVMAGYVVLGIGFGVLLQSKGYSFIWAFVMSVTIFAGAMQYVAVDLLSMGAGFIATAIMTVMVNVRHVFYGVAMLDKYKDMGKVKPYLIFGLTDETFSIACNVELPENINKRKYFFLLTAFNQCYWIIGSTLGAVLGSAIEFNSAGIDFSMTALFVVIFVEQWEKAKNHIPAIVGIVVTVICLVIFGPSSFLIPSMIAITIVLVILRGKLEGKVTAEGEVQND